MKKKQYCPKPKADLPAEEVVRRAEELVRRISAARGEVVLAEKEDEESWFQTKVIRTLLPKRKKT